MEGPTANGRHGPPQSPNMPHHTRAGAQWSLGTWAGDPRPVWAPPVCPCGLVGPTPTGHSRHGAPCPFGHYWSFGLLVLGGGRERSSLPSAVSTEATAERKAYLTHKLFCKIICGAGCTCCCRSKRPATPPSTTTHGAAITVHICTSQLMKDLCRDPPFALGPFHAPF